MSPHSLPKDAVPNYKTWPKALKGELGIDQQKSFYDRLTSYLYVVAYNCLVNKQLTCHRLLLIHDEELSAMAEDYVQQFMVRMVQNDYHLLSKFAGRSKFTTWAAQVMNNMIRADLRKAEWNRCQQIDDHAVYIDPDALRFREEIQKEQVIQTLYLCLEQLPALYRTVLMRFVMHGEPASDVAEELERTVQAVYNLAGRAKKQLMALLTLAGVDGEDLAIFIG